MPLIECPNCGEDADLSGVPMDNGQIATVCGACGEEWAHGEPKRVYKTVRTFEDLRRTFPSPDDVSGERRQRTDDLKAKFLADHPVPRPEVAEFWAKYSRLFSREGLPTAPPQD